MNNGFFCTQCIVCGREDKYRKKLRFFRFPKETERCRKWLRVIGIKDLINMSMSELFEQMVCEIHFHKRCFSGKGKRLLKMALPTMFTSHPPLSAKIMAEWPPKYGQVLQIEQDDTQVNKGGNRNPTLHDTEPGINYLRPLMTCMETLINNKQGNSKKPIGVPNTISVPLMTYFNSLEKGTVFAPEEPENLADLPVVFIERVDLNLPYTKNLMEFNTTETTLDSELHENVTHLPNLIGPSQFYGTAIKHTVCSPINNMKHLYNTGTLRQYKTPKATALMNSPNISLSPFTESMNQEYADTTAMKSNVVSFGLNTIIRTKKRNSGLSSQTVPTRNDSNHVLGPNSVQATIDSNTNFGGTPEPNTVNVEHWQTNSDSATMDTVQYACPNVYAKLADLNDKFMLYSEHTPTASPESLKSYFSEFNIDSGIPLLNCVENLLPAIINYNANPEDLDNAVINVPLLRCTKIINTVK